MIMEFLKNKTKEPCSSYITCSLHKKLYVNIIQDMPSRIKVVEVWSLGNGGCQKVQMLGGNIAPFTTSCILFVMVSDPLKIAGKN